MLLPLFDPPRHDTKDTIEKCIAKGIQVKMVTGDQLLIGKETAKQLGMGTNMYTTEVLLAVSLPRPASAVSVLSGARCQRQCKPHCAPINCKPPEDFSCTALSPDCTCSACVVLSALKIVVCPVQPKGPKS